MLSVCCLNGQVSLREAFDLLMSNTETLHFLPAFKNYSPSLLFNQIYAGEIEEYPATE